jgi:hypothetical protein
MLWLWILTLFSASTAVVTGIGWWVTWYRLDTFRWKVKQDAIANKHAPGFHACGQHNGLFAGAEAHERAQNLHDIGVRNRARYQTRTD